MLRLLQIEFLKVKPYKTFWAFMIIYAGLILVYSNTGGSSLIQSEMFGFPLVWQTLTQMASFLNILMGILIIVLICNEFSFRTLRQHVVDGLSRDQVVTAKFILIKAIALGCILFLFLYGMIKGLTSEHFDHYRQVFDKVHFLALLFLQMAGYMAIAAALAFIIRRSGITIVVFLLFIVLEYLFEAKVPDEIECYFPIHIFASLLSVDPEKQVSTTTAVIISVCYFLACLTFSRLLMQRRAL